MKRINYLIIFIIGIMTLQSCNSDLGEPLGENRQIFFKVDKLSHYMHSKSRTEVKGQDVLVFPNEDSYNQTLEKVRNMNASQRIQFFDSIGFNGAYSILYKANKELDEVFDLDENTDSTEITRQMIRVLHKYDNILNFEGISMNDVTPSLTFKNKDLELIGSLDGYVIIGDSIVRSDDSLISSDNNIALQGKSCFAGLCEVSVKNNNIYSKLRIGRLRWNVCFAIDMYRTKCIFFKKWYYDKRHYGKIELSTPAGTNVAYYKLNTHPTPQDFYWNIAPSGNYPDKVVIKITDFCCESNLNNKVTKSFTIKMK